MVEISKADLIMRLGGWTRRSDSFLFYVTNTSVRGELSTTSPSYGQDKMNRAAPAAIDAQRNCVTRLVLEIVGMLESNDAIEAVRACLDFKAPRSPRHTAHNCVNRSTRRHRQAAVRVREPVWACKEAVALLLCYC